MKEREILYLIYSRGAIYGEEDYLIAIYDNEKSAKEHLKKQYGFFLEIEEHYLYTEYKNTDETLTTEDIDYQISLCDERIEQLMELKLKKQKNIVLDSSNTIDIKE